MCGSGSPLVDATRKPVELSGVLLALWVSMSFAVGEYFLASCFVQQWVSFVLFEEERQGEETVDSEESLNQTFSDCSTFLCSRGEWGG